MAPVPESPQRQQRPDRGRSAQTEAGGWATELGVTPEQQPCLSPPSSLLPCAVCRPQPAGFQATFLALLREKERHGRAVDYGFYYYFQHVSKVYDRGIFT